MQNIYWANVEVENGGQDLDWIFCCLNISMKLHFIYKTNKKTKKLNQPVKALQNQKYSVGQRPVTSHRQASWILLNKKSDLLYL